MLGFSRWTTVYLRRGLHLSNWGSGGTGIRLRAAVSCLSWSREKSSARRDPRRQVPRERTIAANNGVHFAVSNATVSLRVETCSLNRKHGREWTCHWPHKLLSRVEEERPRALAKEILGRAARESSPIGKRLHEVTAPKDAHSGAETVHLVSYDAPLHLFLLARFALIR